MIPVQLTIKGLYSYAKSATIDFKPLVAARLFGIFGPVGSGKSAILEAILFVLFDRSNRLNKAGDDRYYNMMNLQSNELSIDFIFMGGRNHKTKYRFYFMARRNSRDFQKVEVKDRSYYQWHKSDWKPLKKPDVLGMT
jgi:exonuclease SbcC